MPPATAASKSRSTLAPSATANSSAPWLASSSLLAVMTGLPDFTACTISSRAGSMPPMTSTTRSIVGVVDHGAGVVGEHPLGQFDRALAGHVAHRDLGHLQPQAGAGLDHVALGLDQADQGRPDVAAAEHPDPHPLFAHAATLPAAPLAEPPHSRRSPA